MSDLIQRLYACKPANVITNEAAIEIERQNAKIALLEDKHRKFLDWRNGTRQLLDDAHKHIEKLRAPENCNS